MDNNVANAVVRVRILKQEVIRYCDYSVYLVTYRDVMRPVMSRVYHEVCEEIYAELWQKVE